MEHFKSKKYFFNTTEWGNENTNQRFDNLKATAT